MATNQRTIGRRKITVTIGPTPRQIIVTTKYVTDFELLFPTTNVAAFGNVGDSTVDATWITRTKGTIYNFVHGTGVMDGVGPVTSIDLSKIYVITSNPGDVCIVEYFDYDV